MVNGQFTPSSPHPCPRHQIARCAVVPIHQLTQIEPDRLAGAHARDGVDEGPINRLRLAADERCRRVVDGAAGVPQISLESSDALHGRMGVGYTRNGDVEVE